MKKMFLNSVIVLALMTGIVGCQKQDMDESATKSANMVEVESSTECEVQTKIEVETETESETEMETETEIESENETEEVIEGKYRYDGFSERRKCKSWTYRINNLTEDQENMFYVMDALAELCYDEQYNPNDTNFFWRALYYFVAVNPPFFVDETVEGSWLVESSRVEKYAAGLFENYNGLPEIPEDTMIQAQEDGYYAFGESDRGLEHSEIASWTVDESGINKVIIELVDNLDDDAFAVYEMTLVDNPQLAVDSNQIFKYSVRNVERIK